MSIFQAIHKSSQNVHIIIQKKGGPLDDTPGSRSGCWLYGMGLRGVAVAGDTVGGDRIRCRSVPAGMRSTLLTFGSRWITLDQVSSDPKNLKKMLINEHKNRKIYNWIIGSQNNCCFMYFMFFIYPFILFFYRGSREFVIHVIQWSRA